MTEELFIGGPLAGWQDVDQYGSHGGRVFYPITRPVSFEAVESGIYDDRIGAYFRRRYWHTSWRIILAAWATSETDRENYLTYPPWQGEEHYPIRAGMHSYWLQRPGSEQWAKLQAAWDAR